MAVKLNRLLTQGRHTALVFDVCFFVFFFLDMPTEVIYCLSCHQMITDTLTDVLR